MGACPYGASVAAGQPATYFVTDADLQAWFGDAYWKLYFGVTVHIGEGWDTASLALLNPNPPVMQTDADLTALMGEPAFTVYTLNDWITDVVKYGVFYKTCVCNGDPLGGMTCIDQFPSSGGQVGYTSGAFSYGNSFTVLRDGVVLSGFQLHTSSGWSGTESFRVWDEGTGPSLLSTQVFTFTGVPGLHDYTLGVNVPLTTGHTYRMAIAVGSGNGWYYTPVANMLPSAYATPGQGYVGARTDPPTYPTTANPWWAFDPILCVPAGSGAAGTPPAQPPLTNIPNQVPTSGSLEPAIIRQITEAKLELMAMADLVKAMQRQMSPFGYVAGTSHAIAGTGQIAVSGLLGVAVTFTAIPGRLPVEAGTPDNIWQLGRLSFGTAEGWQRNITLTHSPALVVPISAFVTQIGYTLPVGVTGTLTELKAEP